MHIFDLGILYKSMSKRMFNKTQKKNTISKLNLALFNVLLLFRHCLRLTQITPLDLWKASTFIVFFLSHFNTRIIYAAPRQRNIFFGQVSACLIQNPPVSIQKKMENCHKYTQKGNNFANTPACWNNCSVFGCSQYVLVFITIFHAQNYIMIFGPWKKKNDVPVCLYILVYILCGTPFSWDDKRI